MKNKNIWLLPTNQASRLYINNQGKWGFSEHYLIDDRQTMKNHNIYITSDEEIKEGDWYLDTTVNVLFKNDRLFLNGTGYKKTILTTDQDLIKDGVQAIDDEFLEWFVKNPSCEFVEISKKPLDSHCEFFEYKIIIPQEEPKPHILSCCISLYECYCGKYPKQEPKIDACKHFNQETGCDLIDCPCEKEEILKGAKEKAKQETLEEAELTQFALSEAKKWVGEDNHHKIATYATAITVGANWQKGQEKHLYSEEEMLNFAWFLVENIGQYSCDRTAHFKGEYLKKFKNKL